MKAAIIFGSKSDAPIMKKATACNRVLNEVVLFGIISLTVQHIHPEVGILLCLFLDGIGKPCRK